MLTNSQLNLSPRLARYSLVLSVVLTVLTVLTLASCPPAFALLRQHHETPDVLRYHAQDSLKDRDGNTWQVLLFPDQSGTTTKYFLRLVGFPGVNSFQHPQSLEILTSEGKIIAAIDAYKLFPAVDNVGQYDLTSIIEGIPAGTVKLSTPLQNNRELALKIPAEVTSEWQLLVRELEPNS